MTLREDGLFKSLEGRVLGSLQGRLPRISCGKSFVPWEFKNGALADMCIQSKSE